MNDFMCKFVDRGVGDSVTSAESFSLIVLSLKGVDNFCNEFSFCFFCNLLHKNNLYPPLLFLNIYSMACSVPYL